MTDRRPVVAVVGAADITDTVGAIAHDVGRAIAEKEWHLVCGGKQGVMKSACKGFRFGRNELSSHRVLAFGMLPEADSHCANDYIDVAIPTGMGIARNSLIVTMAQGIIAVGGGSGTLSELAYAWQMNKPIVCMLSSGGWSEQLAGTQLDHRRSDVLQGAQTAREAIEYLAHKFETWPVNSNDSI